MNDLFDGWGWVARDEIGLILLRHILNIFV